MMRWSFRLGEGPEMTAARTLASIIGIDHTRVSNHELFHPGYSSSEPFVRL